MIDGALLINKHAGVSSFGVIEELQRLMLANPASWVPTMPLHGWPSRDGSVPPPRKRDLPKMGHGGTLDPFATGLLAVCIGRGVKLARYFLGSRKTYDGVIRFGETTIPGDPTEPVSERSDVLPASLEDIRTKAHEFTLEPYLQLPPMHSAVKKDGKPLYELARKGIEVERDAKKLTIYSFEIQSYSAPRAPFVVECSPGTYVRTLSQDLGKRLGTVAMLDSLNRVSSGSFKLENAWTVAQVLEAASRGERLDRLACWVPFDQLLSGYDRAEATQDEATALIQGRQQVLPKILARAGRFNSPTESPASADFDRGHGSNPSQPHPSPLTHIAIYHSQTLVAVARQDNGIWGLERVFTSEDV